MKEKKSIYKQVTAREAILKYSENETQYLIPCTTFSNVFRHAFLNILEKVNTR